MEKETYRIDSIRDYFLKILGDTIKELNVDYLDNDEENYTLNKIPVQPVEEKWIIPITKYKEAYNLISRRVYTPDISMNLSNIGFFEKIENTIRENNRNKILPEIVGIESIECLNCGTLLNAQTNTAVFSLQIQIIYRDGDLNA